MAYCFELFEHIRGPGTVDKIKKYRGDRPSGIFTHQGRRLLMAVVSKNPRGTFPTVFLIIVSRKKLKFTHKKNILKEDHVIIILKRISNGPLLMKIGRNSIRWKM